MNTWNGEFETRPTNVGERFLYKDKEYEVGLCPCGCPRKSVFVAGTSDEAEHLTIRMRGADEGELGKLQYVMLMGARNLTHIELADKIEAGESLDSLIEALLKEVQAEIDKHEKHPFEVLAQYKINPLWLM